MSSIRTRHIRMVQVVAIVALSACSPDAKSVTGPDGKTPTAADSAALRAVLAGNEQAVLAAPLLVQAGSPLAPFVEARLFAISNVAMHDAMNAILPRFERYADKGSVVTDANAAAAILTAAHDAIGAADPAAQTQIDAWYATVILPEQPKAGFAAGVQIGHRAAAAVMALRAKDGTAGGGVAPYTPGTLPGDYRFTVPFNTPPFDFFGTGGFADASGWGGNVLPFVVKSTHQFRVSGPYVSDPYATLTNAEAVLSDGYTDDFNEVKELGCNRCTQRTAAQTEIGLFWLENSPTAWNRVALAVLADKQLDAWQSARLLALVQMSEFDVYATNLETKYHYNFWRPVTAIALAGTDGNPATIQAADWQELGFPTPPVPEYPSAHAGAGAAAGAIISRIVGKATNIRLTSGSLPGVARSFTNLDDAVRENGLSRIYVGFHFRQSVEAGKFQGTMVGDYIYANALRQISQ